MLNYPIFFWFTWSLWMYTFEVNIKGLLTRQTFLLHFGWSGFRLRYFIKYRINQKEKKTASTQIYFNTRAQTKVYGSIKMSNVNILFYTLQIQNRWVQCNVWHTLTINISYLQIQLTHCCKFYFRHQEFKTKRRFNILCNHVYQL